MTKTGANGADGATSATGPALTELQAGLRRSLLRDMDPEQQARYLAGLEEERRRKDAVDRAAEDLLRAAKALGAFGWGCRDPYEGAMRFLTEAAINCGYIESDPDVGVTQRKGQLRDERAAPSRKHRRLHELADRDGGWTCRDCRVGLIDICQDIDVLTDETGGRFVRPDCDKLLPTEDHVVPRQQNGSNRIENLALVCGPCNARKGAA